MYLAVYIYLTFLFIINTKYKKVSNQDTLTFYTSIFFFIFFILNQISADQDYYISIYNRDFFDGYSRQGYDYFFINYPRIFR